MNGLSPAQGRHVRVIRWITLLTLVSVGSLTLAGCLRIKDSPAPGCVKTVGIRPMGGCSGRTVILDLAVEPEIECLSISANNCNGGVLNVRNGCDEPLLLQDGDVEIAAGDRASLDAVEETGGQWQMVVVSSNFSEYLPSEDRQVAVRGTMSITEIVIEFTKTAPLCDDD